MKHKKVALILWLIVANSILLFLAWGSFQAIIWKETGTHNDMFARGFHILGVICAFMVVNWLIDHGTRITD